MAYRFTVLHGPWRVDGYHLQTKLLDATKPQTAPVVALTSTSSMAAKLRNLERFYDDVWNAWGLSEKMLEKHPNSMIWT